MRAVVNHRFACTKKKVRFARTDAEEREDWRSPNRPEALGSQTSQRELANFSKPPFVPVRKWMRLSKTLGTREGESDGCAQPPDQSER